MTQSTNTTQAQHTSQKPIHEAWLLFALAAIQFTTTLDFLIIMPLGPQYMRVFAINPAQFGLMVSAYAISAGISGILAGCFLDRFDRKPALLTLYLGFGVGTLFCAMAPTYGLLVAARVLAGAFGGVSGSLILAIVGDVIPIERRGAAMGKLMSSFSVASICGVPLGVVLATHLSWHVPFYALAGLSLLVLLGVALVMPSLRGHLEHEHEGASTGAHLGHRISREPSDRIRIHGAAHLGGFLHVSVYPNVYGRECGHDGAAVAADLSVWRTVYGGEPELHRALGRPRRQTACVYPGLVLGGGTGSGRNQSSACAVGSRAGRNLPPLDLHVRADGAGYGHDDRRRRGAAPWRLHEHQRFRAAILIRASGVYRRAHLGAKPRG